jgi:hypothetical protein
VLLALHWDLYIIGTLEYGLELDIKHRLLMDLAWLFMDRRHIGFQGTVVLNGERISVEHSHC